MTNICMYFQVHQPFRLKQNYSIFDIGKNNDYFDDEKNKQVMQKIANKCYLPANKILLDLIKKYDGRFKVSFSITGTALEQFELYAPEVLESFKELAYTGCVEFLSETYHHSLAFLTPFYRVNTTFFTMLKTTYYFKLILSINYIIISIQTIYKITNLTPFFSNIFHYRYFHHDYLTIPLHTNLNPY